MGREALCQARWPGGSGEVKALLETQELIFRGALKRTIAIAQLDGVRVAGDELLFSVGNEHYALALGASVAASWAKKIATPPPTLRQKLGLGTSGKALVIGSVVDAALETALKGETAAAAGEAEMSVAAVEDETQLLAALAIHERTIPQRPIWIAHRKGAKALFGDNAVRVVMRQRGYIDSKSTAVSADFSATRYARK